MDQDKIKQFQQKIFSYYEQNRRTLPWRKTTNPYKILLSEIMLQQTQVDRVITYYEKWTKKWPTVKNLANAHREEILEYWMGLGYNNRAVNLHKGAKAIVEKFNGNVLQAMEYFQHVPGVGPYTSAAVQIFSANKDLVTVDTNIRRILIHEFSLDEKTNDKELWDLAQKCLPKGRSRDWHNALMDYGATLLTSRKTGIKPKTQQSKFEGSDRQIRAKILKFLLIKKEASFEELQELTKAKKERLQKITAKMVKDTLIRKKEDGYILSQ